MKARTRKPPVPTEAEVRRWAVVLPFHPAPLNALMRMHWAARGRVLASEAAVIALRCNEADVPKATGNRRVTQRITLVGRDRRRDDDNAWKGVLDALVKCGRLVDDGPDFVERTPLEFDRGTERKTTLIIEDLL